MELKDVANYQLNHCYVMGEVEETRDYYYYAINHLNELKKLFFQLGYTLVFYPAPLKVIMLVNENEGNQAKLSKYESIILLICRLLYLQKREMLNTDGNRVIVTVEQIQTEYQKMNLPRKLDRPALEEIMRTLKNYNLARQLDRLSDPAARIEIYPSVMLALPDNVLRASQEETEKELAKYQTGGEEET
jgi:hypothetical protein